MTSHADEPLLARQSGDFEDDAGPDGQNEERVSGNDTGHTGRLGFFVWLLTLSAGISGLLFGCQSVLISLYPSMTN